MTRIAGLKLGYAGAVVVGIGIAAVVFLLLGGNTKALLIVCGTLLVPGRIVRYIFRDFDYGRRLLLDGRLDDSIAYSERFLAMLRSRPKRKRLFWLAWWSFYTTDLEAMTLNNLGCAFERLGRVDQAENAWRDALRLDPQYPIPHLNLAIVLKARRDDASAFRALEEAQRLGYRAATVEHMTQQANEMQSRIESQSARD